MKIIIFGAAGFIGTNLSLKLAQNSTNKLTLVDEKLSFFASPLKNLKNVTMRQVSFMQTANFDELLQGQDIVYHLVSTSNPSNSNQNISAELHANVIVTATFLDACVRCKVKRIIFLSSGGTVYGKEAVCPIKEISATEPICSYGLQKITIEKLIYLYNYIHGLDYRIVRLSNPYGPYQRPNGVLGAVTTFTFKALRHEEIVVFGDGSVVRDYIYIDDAIRAIVNIAEGERENKIYNLGCGYGTSVNELLESIRKALKFDLRVKYTRARKADVPINYLDISRYENDYGKLAPISLEEGIKKASDFMRITEMV